MPHAELCCGGALDVSEGEGASAGPPWGGGGRRGGVLGGSWGRWGTSSRGRLAGHRVPRCTGRQAPTAAACCSMPQRQILGAVGWGFEACRSMPQHAAASQNFHMADLFFMACQTCEPFVAQTSQSWMVAQWSMYQVPGWKVLGSIPGKGNLERAIFCLSVPLYCCTDLRFFGVVLKCQVLRILELPRHHRSRRSLRNPQGTRRQPGVQQIVCSGPLGKVLGTTSA